MVLIFESTNSDSVNNASIAKPGSYIFSTETVFTVFLFAGVYKTAEFLDWFPVDLTAFFAALTCIATVNYLYNCNYTIQLRSLVIISIFLLFTIYSILSGVWSPSTDYYFSKSFRLLFITSLALIVPAIVISSSRKRLWRAGAITMVLGLPVASETIRLGFLNGFSTVPVPLNAGYLIAGRLLGFGILILVFYVLFIQPSKFKTTISLCLGGMYFLALLILGARGPLIATVCSLLLLISFVHSYNVIKLTKSVAVGYIVATPIVIGILITIAGPLRSVRRLGLILQGGGNSLQSRLDMYSFVIQNIDFPSIIIGNGLGSFAVIYFSQDSQSYPHNILLEALFELGIVGLIILLVLIGYSLYGSLPKKANGSSVLNILLFVLFIYMFLNAGVTGDFNENRYFFAVVGLMAYRFKHRYVHRTTDSSHEDV